MRRSVLAVVLPAVLLVAGCGGDSGGGGGSKEEFVSGANEVCRELAEQLAGVGSPESPEAIARYGAVTAQAFTKARTELKELGLPSGEDRAGAEAYVRSYDRLAPIVARLRSGSDQVLSASREEDAAAVTRATQALSSAAVALQRVGGEADEQAERYGLETCAG